MSEKDIIIRLFNERVRGRHPETTSFNQRHDGKVGHWLEKQMGIHANSSNTPDLFGYEMKNDTTSKTTFGDWSANYYIFKRNNPYGLTRSDFLRIFGKPNPLKNGRHSWSGEPIPSIKGVNKFGQNLFIDSENNIHAKYHYSKDERPDKVSIVPFSLRIDDLTIARWDAGKLQKKVENKFNKMGWFKCLRDSTGAYSSIVFGDPINYETWISLVKTGDIYFDSGMYEGNIRPYSQWRADNALWNKLITSKH
ncbi:Restriction endonuclease, type II, LlaMI [Burkholderiaceae bacterium]